MTEFPEFARTVQFIARTKNTSGSSYTGTTWNEAAPVETQAVFAPGGSTEQVQGADTVIAQPTLYGVDPALGVKATDAFLVDGERYEVDGRPQAGWAFTDWQPGDVVTLRKETG